MSRRTRHRSSRNVQGVLLLLFGLLFAVIGCCCGTYALLGNLFDGKEKVGPTVEEEALTIAYSPEKEPMFTALVDGFNAQGLKTPEGKRLRVVAVPLDPEAMVEAVLDGEADFQAITPDASVWLGQLDAGWSEKLGDEGAAVVGETVRYAISPVVIAAWEGLAREIGWPERSISWGDLLNRAQSDPNFKWSHPSTSSSSGLLATLAMFYAGAGKTRGLTVEDVTDQKTLDYVAALEKTVRYYGEGDEPALIEQALQEGRDFLDAFVVQEQMVVYFNTHRRADQERLVALYPAEGALWEDHPLALLETTDLTPYHRQVFAQFRDYILAPEAQQLILSHGYRPGDHTIPLTGPDSPLTAENGVDPAEPTTSLQVPNASVIAIVRDVWWYTKRHTNVYLVVDTSGSMRGAKLTQTQAALHAFLDQIQGDMERVGLIEFDTGVRTVVYLDELGDNRAVLEAAVDALYAEGDTALLDGVAEANRQLQKMGDTERINAIVVMTDGRENASSTRLQTLIWDLTENARVPVVVFSIAYGSDADMNLLRAISEPTGGQVREGDLETIQDLYKILSTYF
ncbi:MAG TPA: VWA domain-containing protein [Anaerolineae bacterium]|nr:VWA domain-containing protein [Anaerolineae bacterium]